MITELVFQFFLTFFYQGATDKQGNENQSKEQGKDKESQ